MTRHELSAALFHVLGDDPGIAVIHSSFANLGPPAGTRQWDLIYPLHQLIAAGWTIALPAFTFSFCNGEPFDAATSRSEVGILADVFREGHRNAERTRHPIYSFVTAGPRASELVACAGSTTFGDDSVFGLFERDNAHLVMLGCGWAYPTQIHRYEELARVPYRYMKTFEGLADFRDGRGAHRVEAKMYVRDLEADARNDFGAVEASLRQAGLIRSARLWRGVVESARTAEVAHVSSRLLSQNPLALLANAAEVARIMRRQETKRSQPPVRVAVLGRANVHILAEALTDRLRACITDRRIETFEVPYGQLDQALLAATSELYTFKPNVSIFCDRLEDLAGRARLDGFDIDLSVDLARQHGSVIRRFHATNGGWVLVHRFGELYEPNDADSGETARVVAAANEALERELQELTELLWIDPARAAASAPTEAVDFRLWMLGRFPFAAPFSSRLADLWAGKILAVLGRSVRALIVDLDNTVWGGVLGEDGPGGLRLGGDFPGNAFQAFQEALIGLTRRGIGLAICSKNDADIALKAIDELPGMQFRTKDLIGYRINWQSKTQNILALAQELNLGLESLLFIDDNPAEREAVRQSLPELRILDLPQDPADAVPALLNSPWLQASVLTPEDLRRVQSYHTRRDIEQLRSSAGNLENFFAGLQMRLHLQPLDETNLARAAQLCSKTNQFNTTTRRYDASDLRRLASEGADVIVIGLEDKQSERENIGLIILKAEAGSSNRGVIDLYLLSCRVLGRGLESSVVQWAIQRARARQWSTLAAELIATERNTPARGVYAENGFVQKPGTSLWLRTTDDPESPASWLTIVDCVSH